MLEVVLEVVVEVEEEAVAVTGIEYRGTPLLPLPLLLLDVGLLLFPDFNK